MTSADVNGVDEPRGAIELAIAQAWKDAFRLERIGRNDNFFELGGDSLLGMSLSEKVSLYLGIQVPVVALFQFPSVRELAEAVAANSDP